MIFSTGIKKVYESISSAPKENQEKLFGKLEEKLLASKPLSYKFNLLEAIKKAKGSLSPERAEQYIAYLKRNHATFLQENNSVAIFHREEKKLLEFFNVNIADIQPTELDLVINKKDNRLNESIIKAYITNANIVPSKVAFANKKASILESFRNIKKDKNVIALENHLDFIKTQSRGLSDKYRKMIGESINVIRDKSFNDFDASINHAYKLKLITEKLLREFPEGEDVITDKEWSDWEGGKGANEDKINYMPDATLSDVGIFSNIKARFPQDYERNGIELEFNMPIYATNITYSDLGYEARELEEKIIKYRQIFKRILYNLPKKVFTINNIKFMVELNGKNVDPLKTDPFKKQIQTRGFFNLTAFFDVIVFVEKVVRKEIYEELLLTALQQLSDYFQQSSELSDVMSPDIQKERLASNTGGRSKEYKAREYSLSPDKHGEQSDTWSDNILSGEAGESEIADNSGLKGYFDEPGAKKAPKPVAKKHVPAAVAEPEVDDTAGAAAEEQGYDDDEEDF